MLVVWSGFVIGGLVALGARAVANGYLLVMYWKRHGLYLLERGSDGRYHLFRTYQLPLVLLRYLVFSAVYSMLLLHQRSRGWAGPRKPIAATAKA